MRFANPAAGLVGQEGIGHGDADLEEDPLFVLRDQTPPAPVPNQGHHPHGPDDHRPDHREDDADHQPIDTRRPEDYPFDFGCPRARV